MAGSYNMYHYAQNPIPFESEHQLVQSSQLPLDAHLQPVAASSNPFRQPEEIHPHQLHQHQPITYGYTPSRQPNPLPVEKGEDRSRSSTSFLNHDRDPSRDSSYPHFTPRLAKDDLPPPYDTFTAPQTPITTSFPYPTHPTSLSLSSNFPDQPKLIAIPATEAKLGSPFLRAYPPALQASHIPRETFLKFLDHLNRVSVASPPIQALGLAGNIVSFVPLHTTQIVGGAVNAAASLTTIAMSKGRTEMLLREANREIFGPRSLQVQVAKLSAVARLAGMPILDADGEVDKRSPILAPFGNDDEARTVTAQQRRLKSLEPWISPLDVEALPALDQSASAVGRMHAAVSEKQRISGEKKMLKGREKSQKGGSKRQVAYEEKMRDLAEEDERIRQKDGRRANHDLKRVEEKRRKVVKEYGREMKRSNKDSLKDDVEEKSLRKIAFLVITGTNVARSM